MVIKKTSTDFRRFAAERVPVMSVAGPICTLSPSFLLSNFGTTEGQRATQPAYCSGLALASTGQLGLHHSQTIWPLRLSILTSAFSQRLTGASCFDLNKKWDAAASCSLVGTVRLYVRFVLCLSFLYRLNFLFLQDNAYPIYIYLITITRNNQDNIK